VCGVCVSHGSCTRMHRRMYETRGKHTHSHTLTHTHTHSHTLTHKHSHVHSNVCCVETKISPTQILPKRQLNKAVRAFRGIVVKSWQTVCTSVCVCVCVCVCVRVRLMFDVCVCMQEEV